ncbi:uncharacterized protein LOC111362759 [Spodoptera litura]|uniref:Uncharacterized protein LOC111362759 n=1 Tax=Spodoptera litura TaxID=69820 RepID=A0A9J7IZI1_SPOLT|nr:uncharacterized protein LOC111362759 [Spodoptera litura]
MDAIEDCDESGEKLLRVGKRQRGDSSEEENWKEVKGKKSRRSSIIVQDKYEVYISYKERLPKQFALARIFKVNNIKNICQVKYLSPFKIRLQFESESNSRKLFECETLLEKGWRFQKATELSVCYGLIKDVDLDLPENEIIQYISCPSPAKLISLKKLIRRDRNEGGWCPSETIRLCFEGDYLPSVVQVCDIQVKVVPYIHQVAQCSQCWRFGHTRKMCPAKKVTCPKCSGHHDNCDASVFSCVNCGGKHISLSRTGPMYKKERKLREIMAEFRCTYRKALQCYVSPEHSGIIECTDPNSFPPLRKDTPSIKIDSTPQLPVRPTYAETVQTKATVHKTELGGKSSYRPGKIRPKTKKQSPEEDLLFWSSLAGSEDKDGMSDDGMEQKDVSHFSELLSRIKEVIFISQASVSSKIHSVLQLCLEWFMLVMVNYVSEWPWMKSLLSVFISQSL